MPKNRVRCVLSVRRASRHAKLRRSVWLVLLASSFVGCRQQTGEVSQVDTNLGWLGNLYGQYIGDNQGHTPKNIEEFRKYVETRSSADELARLNVSNANELFVSPRDGKPFQMVSYAKLPPPVGGEPPPIVLYESAGKDGKRVVAFPGGGTQTMAEEELQKILPATASSNR